MLIQAQIIPDTGALTGGSKWGEKWDTGNNFSDGTFTAPVAGKYYFEVMCRMLTVFNQQ